jgi:hypothetical protein
MALTDVPAGPGREEHQQGTQALAAGIDNVGSNLVDQCYFAVQTLFDDLIDGLEISGYQSTNLF